MTMQTIIYGDGTHWLFTGTGGTRMLALAAATRAAEKRVSKFVIKPGSTDRLGI